MIKNIVKNRLPLKFQMTQHFSRNDSFFYYNAVPSTFVLQCIFNVSF